MGLDFSHGEARIGYIGFNIFRKLLWSSIGKAIDLYDEDASISHNHPLHDLFNHSDCDGDIVSSKCGDMADFIEKLMANWEESRFSSFGTKFVASLREAAAEGKPLTFL